MLNKTIFMYIFCIFSVLLLISNLLGSSIVLKSKNESLFLDSSDLDKLSYYNLKNWTIMYYMAVNNKYSNKTYEYLEKLTKIGSNDYINIVVFRDGKGKSDTNVYYVEKNNLIDIGASYGWPNEVDSSSPEVLKKFCNDIIADYKANHYALFIMSPGFGWQGLCPDFQNFSYFNFNKYMVDMEELKCALQNITFNGTRKIDIISFNMCLTSMIEVAYEISTYVNYMIASEADNAPMFVWPNEKIIEKLLINPNIETEQIVNDVVDSISPVYYKMHSPFGIFLNNLPFPMLHTVAIRTSLVGIDLNKIQQITKSLEEFTIYLINNIHKYKSFIRESRNLVRTFGGWDSRYHILVPYYEHLLALNIFAYDDYVDLYDFIRLINITIDDSYLKNKCIKLMNDIKNATIQINKLDGDHSYGLSIYFPRHRRFFNKPLYGLKLSLPYEKISFSKNTAWDKFLNKYLEI